MRRFMILLLSVFLINCAFANIRSVPLLDNGSEKFLKIGGEKVIFDNSVDNVFWDGEIHRIGEKSFFLILQSVASNPSNPMGRCGTGNEVSATLYSYEIGKAKLFQKIPVSSCLNDFYLESQFFSDEGREDDFSSIKWHGDLISVSWYFGDKKTITGKFDLKEKTPNFTFSNSNGPPKTDK